MTTSIYKNLKRLGLAIIEHIGLRLLLFYENHVDVEQLLDTCYCYLEETETCNVLPSLICKCHGNKKVCHFRKQLLTDSELEDIKRIQEYPESFEV